MLGRYDHISSRKAGEAEQLNSSLITIEQQPLISLNRDAAKFQSIAGYYPGGA